MEAARIIAIDLDDSDLPAPTPEIDQERRVAIFDLLEDNSFHLKDAPPGPYRLNLRARGRRLTFQLALEDGTEAGAFELSLAPLTQVVRDYGQICQTYFAAVNRQPLAQIEALDEGRRAIHGHGAEALGAVLAPHAEADARTLRRLFSLIAVLTPAA